MNEIIEIANEEQYDAALATSKGRVVALFTAPAWCPPCQKFEPQYEKVAELTDAVLLRIDIDRNPWTAGKVVQVPTIALFEDGEFVRNLQAAGAAAFAQSIEE